MIFIVVIVIFIGALLISSLFPRDWIQTNIEKSCIDLKKESIPSNVLGTYFDNATDILMLNTSYSVDNNKPLESAILARVDYVPSKQQTIYKDITTGNDTVANEEYNPRQQLILTASGEVKESYEYARYWHGYISLLRPLLIFFHYNEIRLIMISILALLAIVLLMKLSKKIKFQYCIALMLALLASEYFIMGFSFQGVMTFVISMLSSIIITTRFDKIKNIGMYFFVIGMLTCYFDLLTHPIITLGIPMIIYMLLKQEREQIHLKETIKIIIINTLLWGIGWGLANVAKWCITDILYNRDIIKKSLEQFLYRSKGVGLGDLAWNVGLQKNLWYSIGNTSGFLMALAIYSMYYIIKNYKNIKANIHSAAPYLIISLMPIVWFIVMRSHTLHHWYFTWRNLIVLYMGIGIFIFKLFAINKTEEDQIRKELKQK